MKTKQKTLSISLEIFSDKLQHEDNDSVANETFIELIKADPGPESEDDSNDQG